MIKVLVSGSNGQLGKSIQAIAHQFPYDFKFTDIDELDITDIDALNTFFVAHSFDYLINCAAYTNVDQAQVDRENALLINATAVSNLAKMSKLHNFHIVQISTDYVFNGKNYRPLTEDYKPHPVNVYGRSKLAGEESLKKHANQGTIIRTSWLYSEYGNNFVKTMLRLAENQDELKIVFDQVGTPTYAHDLAKTILDILPQLKNQKGIELFHYSNEGISTWYDFAQAIFNIADKNIKILPIESKDFHTPAARPYFSVLNKEKIKNAFDIDIPYWRDSLKVCLKTLTKTE